MITTTDGAPDVGAMQDELDRLPERIRQAEADLEAAEQRREVCQMVYDEAGRQLAATTAAGGEGWFPDLEHQLRQPRTAEQMSGIVERRREAEAAFRQADEELGAALVARTEAAKVAGGLLMRRMQLESLLAQAEREQERRAEPEPRRDLLASIRARLFGGDGPGAA